MWFLDFDKQKRQGKQITVKDGDRWVQGMLQEYQTVHVAGSQVLERRSESGAKCSDKMKKSGYHG